MIVGQAESFLQAIVDEPDNDTPRLHYADWLEEHGDPRGEFIRLQCELERMRRYDPRRAELATRAQSLLRAYETNWFTPIDGSFFEVGWSRGFVNHIATTTAVFLEHAPVWFRTLPLQHLKLLYAGRHIEALVECHHLRRLLSVDLAYGWFDPAGVELLARCPYLTRLAVLSLRGNRIGGVGARALARSPYLGQLDELDLIDTRLSEEHQRLLRRRFGRRVQF